MSVHWLKAIVMAHGHGRGRGPWLPILRGALLSRNSCLLWKPVETHFGKSLTFLKQTPPSHLPPPICKAVSQKDPIVAFCAAVIHAPTFTLASLAKPNCGAPVVTHYPFLDEDEISSIPSKSTPSEQVRPLKMNVFMPRQPMSLSQHTKSGTLRGQG